MIILKMYSSRLGKEVKEDMMVNTLEDNDLAKLAAGMKSELTAQRAESLLQISLRQSLIMRAKL